MGLTPKIMVDIPIFMGSLRVQGDSSGVVLRQAGRAAAWPKWAAGRLLLPLAPKISGFATS